MGFGTTNTVQITYRGIDMEVRVDVTSGERGMLDRYNKPATPDISTSIDVLNIIVGIHEGETEIDITALAEGQVLEDIKNLCWLVLNDDAALRDI